MASSLAEWRAQVVTAVASLGLVVLLGACARDDASALLSSTDEAGAPVPKVVVRADRTQVEFGEPFEVEVWRTFEPDAGEPAWPERGLAPLVVVELARTHTSNGTAVVESRRYQAHAFEVGTLVLDSFEFTVGTGAGSDVVRAAPLVLDVRSSLAAQDGGAPEPVLDTLGPRRARWPWFTGGAALLLGTLAFARRRRSNVESVPAPTGPPQSDDVLADLLARLDRLGAAPSSRAQADWYAELNDVVRAALGAQLHVDLASATGSELLLRAPASLDLGAFVARADRARFAAQPSGPVECQRDLALARDLVRVCTHDGGRP